MPRYPKPDSERRNRTKPVFEWTILPAVNDSPIPRVPSWGKLSKVGRAWWRWAWRQSPSAAWRQVDLEPVVRLARLHEEFAESPSPALSSQMNQLEDRLGMTPKARLQLRWLIVGESPRELEERKGGDDPPAPKGPSPYEGLRVALDETA